MDDLPVARSAQGFARKIDADLAAKRFMDRVYEYEQIAPGPVEPFVYSRSEWEQMWRDLHLTYLEAADYGLPLFDRGAWARLREEFARYLAAGVVERRHGGWQRYPERAAAG